MNTEKKEIRTYKDAPGVRVREENDRPATIEGYAVVFNSRSELMYDWMAGEPFYETIDPNAISQDDLNSWDVRATLEHDFGHMLARSRNGQGSLSLVKDEKGVRYSFVAPHTADGERACEQIKRGELFGSSFMFSFDEKTGCTYTRDKENHLCRCVNRIDRMYDVSIVQNPAYQASSVTERSLEELGVLKPASPSDDGRAEADRILRQKDMEKLNVKF